MAPKAGGVASLVASSLNSSFWGTEPHTDYIFLYGGGGGTGAKLARFDRSDNSVTMLDEWSVIDYPRLDETHIFWKSQNTIQRMALGDTVPTTVASFDNLISMNAEGPDLFASTKDTQGNSSISRIGKWGGAPVELTTAPGYFVSVSASSEYVYWIAAGAAVGDAKIQVVPRNGGSVTTAVTNLTNGEGISSMQSPQLMADETGVFWISDPNAKLMHLTKDDWQLHEITAADCYSPEGARIVQDANAYYWAACGKVYKLPK